MTVVNINSISGINSITAQSGNVAFYDTSGNLASIGASLSSSSTISSINGGPISGARNRVINGDMRIDQRNAGAALNNAADGSYAVDRWIRYQNVGASNIGRNLNGITPPAGFTNYLGIQISTAGTATASQYTNFQQHIEGFNAADFAWGTASAQSVTISFWVLSSLTGSQGFALQNATSALGYSFTATINTANTWEYKTVTIPGVTTGTWDTTTGRGISLIVDLGQGSNYRFTSGSWQAGNVQGATGALNLNQTLNATFYITGVQLELGTVATPFERRIFSQELQFCERYYEKSYDYSVVPGSVADAGAWESVSINVADFYDFGRLTFKTRKRTTPTLSLWSTNGISGQWRNVSANANQGNSGSSNVSETAAHLYCNNNAMTGNNAFRTQWTASAEL